MKGDGDMPDQPNSQTELHKIDAALAAQEALRGILPDEQLEATLASLRAKRQVLLAQINIDKPQEGGVEVKARDVSVGRDMAGRDINTHITINPPPPGPKTLPLPEALR